MQTFITKIEHSWYCFIEPLKLFTISSNKTLHEDFARHVHVATQYQLCSTLSANLCPSIHET